MENVRCILRDQSVEATDVSPSGILVLRHRIALELVSAVLPSFELVPTTPSQVAGSPTGTIELCVSSEITVGPTSALIRLTVRPDDLVLSDPTANMKVVMVVTPWRTP
jgi:hypothetical protein